MSTATEPTRWKSPYRDADDYRWHREYDAESGIRETIRMILINHCAAYGGIGYRPAMVDRLADVIGAVAPERRAVLADTIIDAWQAWWTAHKASDKAARFEASLPLGRLLDEAADAQISGIRFLYCGGAR